MKYWRDIYFENPPAKRYSIIKYFMPKIPSKNYGLES